MKKLCLCALVLVLCGPARAAETWTRLTTPHFELVTSAGEKKGRATLQHFEQVRAFFLKASPLKKKSESPVRIVEFGSAEQFKPYSLRGSSPAFYLGTPAQDYIVLGDPSVPAGVATHEYMHLVIQRSGLKLPVWLNEGWAEVYSTLRPMGKEMAVGDLIAGRMNELEGKEWLDFSTLTGVTHQSREYNETERLGIFYAESWALSHMLYLAPDYQENFGRFVMALHQGKSATEAAAAAWAKTPEKIMADLHAYFGRKQLVGRAFELALEKEAAEPAVTAMTDFDSRLVLADLLAVTNRPIEAKREYDALEKEQPKRADLARSKGHLAIKQRDNVSARKYFSLAFEAGETDPVLCFQLAALERAAGSRPAVTIPILERAIKTKPDFADARIQLGMTFLEAKRYPDAIDSFMALETITADKASTIYCALGYARMQGGDLAEAQLDVNTCTKWARTDREKQGATSLGNMVAARGKPEAAVQKGEKISQAMGTVIAFDCSDKGKVISLKLGQSVLHLDVPEPAAVEFMALHGGKLQLTCGGKLSVNSLADYAPAPKGSASDGILRRLEF